MLIINHLRTYHADETTGILLINNTTTGKTLEDPARPYGVKIPKKTCLPEGVYYATITPSQRFGRPMILLYTDPDLSCTHGGIKYTGIRVHAGSNTEHTDGCVLYRGDLDMLEYRIKTEVDQRNKVLWIISRALP